MDDLQPICFWLGKLADVYSHYEYEANGQLCKSGRVDKLKASTSPVHITMSTRGLKDLSEKNKEAFTFTKVTISVIQTYSSVKEAVSTMPIFSLDQSDKRITLNQDDDVVSHLLSSNKVHKKSITE